MNYFKIFSFFTLLGYSCTQNKDLSSADIKKIDSFIDSSKIDFLNCKYDSVIYRLTIAENLIKKSNSNNLNDLLPIIYNLKGSSYRITGNYVNAFDDYQSSLNISENNVHLINEEYKTNYGLASLFYYYQYYHLEGNHIAKEYINKSLNYAFTKKDSAKVLYFNCELYISLQNVDSAILVLDSLTKLMGYNPQLKIFNSKDSTNFLDMVSFIWEDKAKIARINNTQYSNIIDSALDYSLELTRDMKQNPLANKYQFAFSNYRKGDYLLDCFENFDSAFKFLNTAYNISKEINATYIVELAAEDLSLYYKRKRNFQKSNLFRKEANSLKTKLSNYKLGILHRQLEMQKSLEKNKTKDKYILWLVIIFIFLLFLSVSLISVYFKRKSLRKELNDAKRVLQENENDLKERNEWTSIFNELLIQKDNVLKKDGKYNIQELVNEIRRHFKCEYCGVGVFENHELINSCNYKLTNSQFDALEKIKDFSIMSSLFKLTNTETFVTHFSNINFEKFDNKYVRIFQSEVLKSEKLSNLIFVGLYSINAHESNDSDKLIGYLSIINSQLNKTDDVELESLSKELSHLFDSYFYRRQNEKKERDRDFINDLYKYDDNFDEILTQISTYFIDEFNVSIVSFRVPVLNGQESKEIKYDKLLFPLRHLSIDTKITLKKNIPLEIIENHYKGKRSLLKLSELNYIEELKMNFPTGIHFDQLEEKVPFKPDFELNDIFDTHVKIILPIYKTIPIEKNANIPNWKNLYGIFCLRPYFIENNEELTERLKYLSSHVTYVINGIINKKKHLQINVLKDEIDKLTYSSESFYNQIVNLVAVVINAQICSIFMLNPIENKLVLKATNAKRAVYSNDEISIDDNKPLDFIYYNLSETDSITVKVFLNHLPWLIYSSKKFPHSNKFQEIPQSGKYVDYSILFVPLKDKMGKDFGVLKCLGKISSPSNLVNSFWDFDKETIELVASLAEKFIENSELDKVKDKFIKELVHETLSPLTQILNKSEILQSRIKRGEYKLPYNFNQYFQEISNKIFLFKSVILSLEDASTSWDVQKLKISKVNVRDLILNDVVKLFEESAQFENKKIQTNISLLPDLEVDKLRVTQVFLNLLRNAINYSDSNTVINIYYKECDETFTENPTHKKWHEIKFVNWGIGFPEREVESLFQLYQRASNAINIRPSGTGIGLFLIKKIMIAHDGLCIIRQNNNPTEVSVLFPADKKIIL